MATLKTVKTLFKQAFDNDESLLPSWDAAPEWWAETYTDDNYQNLDILFARLYASYLFYSPLKNLWDDYDDAAALDDFQQAVYTLFLKNDKKYAELYRINTVPDDESYNLTNNYDMHENFSGNKTENGSVITGQRTDVNIDNTGSQNSTGVNKVTGWDSSSENTDTSNTGSIGSRQDTHQFTKGQEQDTSQTAGTEGHTLRRYGNIGVMTVDDMLQKHEKTWINWSFLQIIFNDICSEFLLIGDDKLWW